MQTYAKLRHARISPQKCRLVADVDGGVAGVARARLERPEVGGRDLRLRRKDLEILEHHLRHRARGAENRDLHGRYSISFA